MKKLLKIVDESGDKARIDESVNVSINVSGDSPCDVGEVLAKVTNLSSPRPVTPDMMPTPSAPPPMPMVKAIDIVGKGDGPAVPPAPPGDMAPHTAPEAIGQSVMMPDPSEEPTGGPSTSSQPGGATMGGSEEELEALISDAENDLGLGEGDPEDDEEDDNPFDTIDDIPDHRYNEEEDESLLDPAMGSAHGEGDKSKALTMNSSYKDIHDRLREIDQALKQKDEDFANKPDPKMSDTNYMTKKIAGGLNKPKTMYPNSYKQGDNPMAMETVVRDEWEKFKLGE